MQATEQQRHERMHRALLGFALVVLGILIYGRSLSGAFVYDDLRLIAANPRVTGEAGFAESLFGSFWGFDGNEGMVGYWRPVTILVFRSTAALGAGALGFHIVSLLVHLGAGLAAWRLASSILRSEPLGFLAGAIFLAHPINVEAVVWASSLSDPLCGLFALLAGLGWYRWRERGSLGLPWVALGSFALCLGSKEQGATLLPLLFLLDTLFFSKGTTQRPLWRPSGAAAGLALVAATYYAARVFVFGDVLAGFDRVNAELDMGFARAMWFRVEAFGEFLSLLLGAAPPELFRPFYPVVQATSGGALLAIALLLGWAALTATALRKQVRAPLFALLFVPIALSPILVNPNAAGQFPISDRYLYTAVFAVSLGAAWMAGELLKTLGARAAWATGALVVAALALLSSQRTTVWSSEEILFRQAVQENPSNPFVHWSLGRSLLDRHQETSSLEALQEAHLHFLVSLTLGTEVEDATTWSDAGAPLLSKLELYESSLQSMPAPPLAPPATTETIWISKNDRLQAQLGHGYAELYQADLAGSTCEPALAIFAAAAQFDGASHEVRIALANAHLAQGNLLRAEQSPQAEAAALAEFRAALTSSSEAKDDSPNAPEAWSLFAKSCVGLADWQQAIVAFQTALALRAEDYSLVLDLARCLIEAGQPHLAKTHLDTIPLGDVSYAEGRYTLSLLYAKDGKFQAAIDVVDKLLEQQPGNAQALLLKAKARLALEETPLALEAFQAARLANPRSFEAHYAVASILLASQPSAAWGALRDAYRTSPSSAIRGVLSQQLLLQEELSLEQILGLITLATERGEREHAADFTRFAKREFPTWPGP
jgi:protein O-mannosyl-transferase